MKKLFSLIIALFGVAISLSAQSDSEKIISTYNQGVDYERKADYKNALALFKQAYALGEYYFSPMKIAEFYALGKGVPEDVTESSKWLMIAANNGNAKAQTMVGDLYYYGMGGKTQSLSESAKWYIKAAQQDYPDGQFKIALAYLDGEGITQSNSQGLMWLRKAADNNHPDAQDALAIIYGFGKNGVQKDMNEFVKWALKAAENGNPQSQYRAGSIYLNGLGGIKSDKNKAIEWFKKAAAQGDQQAIQKLSELGY